MDSRTQQKPHFCLTRLRAGWCCMGILLFMMSLSYFIEQNSVFMAASHNLIKELTHIHTLLRDQPNNLDALKREMIKPSYFIRISDEQGHLILASPNARLAPQPAPFPRASDLGDIANTARYWQTDQGESYLLASLHTPLGRGTHLQRLVQIAVDISATQRHLAYLKEGLWMVLLFGLGLLANAYRQSVWSRS